MLELTLIRHAPTSFNRNGIFMGTLDVPLEQETIQLLQHSSLKTREYDLYFSSPLLRAYDTAINIFPNKLIQTDYLLQEKNLGMWSGLNKEKVRQTYPSAFLETGKLNPFFTPIEGEKIQDMVTRVRSFLDKIQSLYLSEERENLKVVGVTHNGVIRIIRHIIQNENLESFFQASEPHLTPIKFYFNEKWVN